MVSKIIIASRKERGLGRNLIITIINQLILDIPYVRKIMFVEFARFLNIL